MQLGAGVEVHHLRVHLIVIIHFCRLHSLIHHRSNLEHLLDCKSLCLVETLRVQSETGFLSEQGAYLLDKLDTVVALIDVVRDVSLGVVA